MARAKTRSRVAIAFTVLILLFLSWQGWVSGRNGLSDAYARPAIDYLEDKSAADVPINDEEWQAVYDNLSRADELMPGNPRYLERLGWLEELKLRPHADVLDIDQVGAHESAAEYNYLGAVAARPTWPYYWGNLALQEYRRGNYHTDEFSTALANTARFGPWKNETQQLVADLGSDTLEFLSSRARQEYWQNLERSLSRQPDALLAIVSDWEYVCGAANVPDVSLPLLSSHCVRVND